MMMCTEIMVDFCWVPSHCGLKFNDLADRAAKDGANKKQSSIIHIPLSQMEMCNILKRSVKNRNPVQELIPKSCNLPRNLSSLAHRLALNSLRTKYCQDVTCICKEKLTIEHLFQCNGLKPYSLPNWSNDKNYSFWIKVAQCLIFSPVGRFL